jgi:hypothetical protein
MANTHSADFQIGSSQYYSAADSASLDITGDLTFEAWIKVGDALTGTWRQILFKDNPSNRSYGFQVRDNSGTNELGIVLSSNGSSLTNKFIDADPLEDGWHHVAVVYDASAGSAEFFKDGLSLGTETGLPTSIFSGNGLLRNSNYVPGDYFDGLIDELRIWDDKRTSTEIADNMCVELVGDEANLQAYWKLNNSLLDETANNNDLTNNNSFTFSTDNGFDSALCAVSAAVTPVPTLLTLNVG